MILIFFVILGFSYGVSFQQFLHFTWADPRGLEDSLSYLAMSNGDYNVSEGHRFRFIIPYLANLVRQVAFIPPDQLNWVGGGDAFSFYFVNSLITSLAGLILYLFLTKLKFDGKLSLLGVFIFLGSRITVLSTGAPMVDSVYFLAIIIVVYLCLTQRAILLSLLNPILILTKETTVPFLFLPLFLKTMNRKLILISLIFSFMILFWARNTVSSMVPSFTGASDPILDVVKNHWIAGTENLRQCYLTFYGWHKIFSAFSVFWVFAAFGGYLKFRKIGPEYEIPLFLFWTVPIVFGFTLLSANTGRMLLSLFPLVIPYALIGIEYLLSQKDENAIN